MRPTTLDNVKVESSRVFRKAIEKSDDSRTLFTGREIYLKNHDQSESIHLSQLSNELQKDLPYSLSVYHIVRQKLEKRSAWPGLSIVVDEFPNFSVCIARTYGSEETEVAPFINDAGIVIYSRDPEKLRVFLQDQPCLDWSRSLYFRSVQWPLDSAAVKKQCESMGGKLHCFDTHLSIYFNLENITLRRILPEGFHVGELNPQHAEQLVQDRDFRCPEMNLLYYRYTLQHHPSAAVFRQGSSAPIAYVLYRPEGCLGMGFVRPEHRGKGLFQIVCYELLKKLKERGDKHSWTHASEDNLPSLKTMLAVGGVIIDGYKVDFMEYVPQNWTSETCLSRFHA